MPPNDKHYTYSEISNEDKELLLSHGYRPNELEPEDMRDLLMDLRDQAGGDFDSDRLSREQGPDERDGTE